MNSYQQTTAGTSVINNWRSSKH